MRKLRFFQEFSRYIIVGGSAFIVDVFLFFLCNNYVFYSFNKIGVYISIAFGFIGGLIYNYILSLLFVFESARNEDKGKTIGAFIVFFLAGVAGLALTESGMYIGIEILNINYLISKVLVSACVLMWNYGVRKILIFR